MKSLSMMQVLWIRPTRYIAFYYVFSGSFIVNDAVEPNCVDGYHECALFNDYLTSLHSEGYFLGYFECVAVLRVWIVYLFIAIVHFLIYIHLLDHNNPISQLIRVNHVDLAMSLRAPAAAAVFLIHNRHWLCTHGTF